ncbi:MAG: aromatic ring-hydroxylating dioxygenase subunit alpha [Prochloraceae cyanobacterium]|nr:aromatic ring-hydroxylating dioxygenase subunit alpha [Prochloraceae cyanobacterium]
MLENFWYAVELSSAVTTKPKQVTIMGRELVLYRDSQKKAVALNNRCAHRGAALSLGWVKKGCIECPYHGWKYQSDGKCVNIPANHSNVSIPKRARVDAYPVQEKYGFIWVFLGDMPTTECPPIPEFSQFEDPVRKPACLEYNFSAHYTRTIENVLDVSHAPFMHKGSVGTSKTPEDTVIEDYELQVSEWGLSATLGIKINKLNGLMKFILPQDDPNAKKEYRFALPNITYSSVQFGSYKIESITAHVPIDETTTVAKAISIRNFLNNVPLLNDWFDRNTAKVGTKICQEDDVVVQDQIPKQVPYNNMSCELLVASDATLIAYRKLLKKYGKQLEKV